MRRARNEGRGCGVLGIPSLLGMKGSRLSRRKDSDRICQRISGGTGN